MSGRRAARWSEAQARAALAREIERRAALGQPMREREMQNFLFMRLTPRPRASAPLPPPPPPPPRRRPSPPPPAWPPAVPLRPVPPLVPLTTALALALDRLALRGQRAAEALRATTGIAIDAALVRVPVDFPSLAVLDRLLLTVRNGLFLVAATTGRNEYTPAKLLALARHLCAQIRGGAA